MKKIAEKATKIVDGRLLTRLGRRWYLLGKNVCGEEYRIRAEHIHIVRDLSFFNQKDSASYWKKNRRMHRIWVAMKQRCTNPNNTAYKYYGGKGILPCSDWMNWVGFYRDNIGRYADNLSIERLDNSKGYSLSNTTWIPMSDQNRNTTRNRRLKIGNETKIIQDWCKIYKIRYNTVIGRINTRGWSEMKALTTPTGKNRWPYPRLFCQTSSQKT